MLILASASPRRRDLLLQAGLRFDVLPAHVDETLRPHELPAAYVQRLALEKAAAIHALHPGAAVLGADTTVVLSHSLPLTPSTANPVASPQELPGQSTALVPQEILGKPTDIPDAERMLRALSGRTHHVHTGIAVVSPHASLAHVETTSVTFGDIHPDDLAHYLSTGDSLDKAGAYGIQGYAARWITRIEGDFFNVVGLPLAATIHLLRQAHAL